ncbi:uncharacterized membrane protein YcaP (DUF421 family) [Bacillus mesophilus]|uniref:DUF421 domain-containing protein n=1 Tax=Bacillus mesophilus TaxID=1808955 RepID=A0A6M0Q8X8_9BACI|nr:DUF421 domain-containing protein [Bacillus mesophilus]MBM7661924.1 uncharacterized membrane protein YcaP (DUF421 family) [Bacillus mesophilus]NEY72717.1 DUF421 domain-containing protein [Bacillus mesophilus]
MDWSLLWKAAIIVIGGTLLLRIAGRKSISQMTIAQVVIMIGLGSLLVQPIVGKNVWMTGLVGFMLVATLVLVEFLQVKFDFLEKFITGQSKILIENGTINKKNLKKLRMTVDQLEMQLRQNNIPNLNNVEYATLEPNGQVGFVLKQNKQTATKEDLNNIREDIQQLRLYIDSLIPKTKVVYKTTGESKITVKKPTASVTQSKQSTSSQNPLFEEVTKKGHKQEPPEYLQ